MLTTILTLLLAVPARAETKRPSEIPLTAEAAAEVALNRSPALKAARARARAEAADARADAHPENPKLTGVYEAGHGDGQTTLALTFDLWSLIGAGARRRAAGAAVERTEAASAEDALALAQDAKAAVYAVQAASATFVLFRERADAVRGGRDRAAEGLAEIEAEKAGAELAAARAELARLLRAPSDSGWWTEARLPEPPEEIPETAALTTLALARRPARAAALAAVRAAEQRARAWSASSAGAMRLGISVEHQPDGRRYAGPAFETDLPIFDPSRPGLDASRARADEAAARADEEEAALTAELETLRARLAAARNEARIWRDTVIPARGDAETRAGRIAALKDYWTTRAALERAVGGSL